MSLLTDHLNPLYAYQGDALDGVEQVELAFRIRWDYR